MRSATTAGEGFSANLPLPAYSTDECYALAFDDVVAPLARAFRPDIIVAQLGVDAHYSDPQTELGLTLPGYRSLVRGIIGLADELCDGRLAALGGGGYHIVEVVPLAWTWLMAELGGRRPGRRGTGGLANGRTLAPRVRTAEEHG